MNPFFGLTELSWCVTLFECEVILVWAKTISFPFIHPTMQQRKSALFQGLKKVLFGCPGHSHLPNGQRPLQVVCQLSKKNKLRLAQGKLKLSYISSFLNPDVLSTRQSKEKLYLELVDFKSFITV